MSAPPQPDQGYPPPQQGYPPQQQGYPPPQQQGYPPPQQPPQQQGYPPAYAPPAQPGYPGPPPQEAYPPQQQQQGTTVVIQQQPVKTNIAFNSSPVTLPDGNVTILRYKTGMLSWIVVGIICLITLECGLCCFAFIALLFDGIKDIEHVHPVTGQVVGVYKRI